MIQASCFPYLKNGVSEIKIEVTGYCFPDVLLDMLCKVMTSEYVDVCLNLACGLLLNIFCGSHKIKKSTTMSGAQTKTGTV